MPPRRPHPTTRPASPAPVARAAPPLAPHAARPAHHAAVARTPPPLAAAHRPAATSPLTGRGRTAAAAPAAGPALAPDGASRQDGA
jgi:hypothetical protein